MKGPAKRPPPDLGPLILSFLSSAIRECPPECGLVSVSKVDVSKDYAYATVFISALSHPKLALASLEERRHELQRKMDGLGRHHTPRLRFRIDTEGEKNVRLEELLR